MQLRKCCNHPMMLKEIHNEFLTKSEGEYVKLLVEASGKMILLDKMIDKFLSENKKILIFS